MPDRGVDLRLRLHQLRLVGELAEIRAADLLSGRNRELLVDASGIALSDAGAALLHQPDRGVERAGLRARGALHGRSPRPGRFVAPGVLRQRPHRSMIA